MEQITITQKISHLDRRVGDHVKRGSNIGSESSAAIAAGHAQEACAAPAGELFKLYVSIPNCMERRRIVSAYIIKTPIMLGLLTLLHQKIISETHTGSFIRVLTSLGSTTYSRA